MERCPVCRAALAGDALSCRRCGCELASVIATEDAAAVLLRTSVMALATGEGARAARLAMTATQLQHQPLAAILADFAEWRHATHNVNQYPAPIMPPDENDKEENDGKTDEEEHEHQDTSDATVDAIEMDLAMPASNQDGDNDIEPLEEIAEIAEMEEIQPVVKKNHIDINIFDMAIFSDYYQNLYHMPLVQKNVTMEHLLENMRLLIYDDHGQAQLSLAGLLGFVKTPQNVIPGAYISAVRWQGNNMHEGSRERQEITGSLTQQITCAEEFMQRNTRISIRINGFQKTYLYQYPRAVLHEVIVNAVTHRDYSLTEAHILLHIFDDRIEVISPGALPAGATLDNILNYCRKPRNEIIAQLLFNFGHTKMLGVGIPMMMRLMYQKRQRHPDFALIDQQFLVRLWAP